MSKEWRYDGMRYAFVSFYSVITQKKYFWRLLIPSSSTRRKLFTQSVHVRNKYFCFARLIHRPLLRGMLASLPLKSLHHKLIYICD